MSITAGDDDVDFSGFNFHKTEVVKADLLPPHFPAQFIPEKLHRGIDKFGMIWENIDKTQLEKDIAVENEKPFVMTDICNRSWEHQDKVILEKFINEQNRKIIQELNYYLGIR